MEEVQRAIAGLSTSLNFEIATLRQEMRSKQDTQKINELIIWVLIVIIVFSLIVHCIIITTVTKRARSGIMKESLSPQEKKLSSSFSLGRIQDTNDNNSGSLQEEETLSESGSDVSQEFPDSPIKAPKLKKAQSFAFTTFALTSEAPL